MFEFKRRRPAAVFAVAAAIAAVVFAVGYAVGNRGNSFATAAEVPMHGVGAQKAATASIQVGKHDTGGNYPLEMGVKGLPALPKGGWYELLLSKKGQPTLPCGDFAVGRRYDECPYVRAVRPHGTAQRQALRRLGRGQARAGQKSAPVVMTT